MIFKKSIMHFLIKRKHYFKYIYKYMKGNKLQFLNMTNLKIKTETSSDHFVSENNYCFYRNRHCIMLKGN